MFDSTLNSAISIDTSAETVHFYYKAADGSFRHDTESYKAKPFSDEFFEKIKGVLKSYKGKNPSAPIQKSVLILPDDIFLTDVISVPFINKRALDNSLTLAINSIYGNANEISYNTYEIIQNKQIATYGLVGIKKPLMASINEAMTASQISPSGITFSANATANGALVLNPKLKSGSFLLLDLKRDSAKFVFVIKGRTMGFYTLPFGYAILNRTKLTSEDLLFDHSSGEILVLNAKEKARAKQLTLGFGAGYEDDPYEEVAEDETVTDEISATSEEDDGIPAIIDIKDGNRKTARKLPKFMTRPAPESEEAYVYENFRIFVKWALDLIGENSAITSLAPMEAVYVNMPEEYNFLYSMINENKKEKRVEFIPLRGENSKNKSFRDLELFGGLYIKQYNKINNF